MSDELVPVPDCAGAVDGDGGDAAAFVGVLPTTAMTIPAAMPPSTTVAIRATVIDFFIVACFDMCT